MLSTEAITSKVGSLFIVDSKNGYIVLGFGSFVFLPKEALPKV